MPTVSRIRLRCRIRILSRGFIPRPNQLSMLTRISARTYSSTKTSETPDERAKAVSDAAKSLEEEFPLADPVKVKLEGRLPRKQVVWGNTKGITTKDVEAFLSKVKRSKKQTEIDKALLPTPKDASKVDRTYEMLLSSKLPPRKPRPPFALTGLPPPPDGLEQKFKFPRATHTVEQINNYGVDNNEVVLHGYIKSARKLKKKLVLLQLYDFLSGPNVTVQLVSSIDANASEKRKEMHNSLMKLPPFVPVAITGTVVKSVSPPPPDNLTPDESKQWSSSAQENRPEIQLESLTQLNSVSPDLIYTPETVFPPEKRHLQLRTTPELVRALGLRSQVNDVCRSVLRRNGFLEVETPLLFKSTPEGAREFLVPTRKRNNGDSGAMCYALPQSPQQYKQILMASGVARYFQLARCFRDEDLRADRQPEFTQLDLEMSFARQEDVIDIMQRLLGELWRKVLGIEIPFQFNRLSYRDAMRYYGTDKPDLRFHKLKIHKIFFDNREGRSHDAQAFYIRCNGARMGTMKRIHDELVIEHQVRSGPDRFMSYIAGEDTANGVPEHRLSAAEVETINESLQLNEGDIVLLKTEFFHFSGGSTRLGQLRSALLTKAIAAKVLRPPNGFEFVWITDFPLFSPVDGSEPGQSGTVGLASTHHPFTAPHEEDFALLGTDPQRVRAEHYDLVVNGVELGGGSRRIHDPELQRYILEEIIKVHPDKVHQFDHLFDVLGSGCPPHAGIALGFDRLIAIMMGMDSVRDVIAFPKNNQGMDPLVKSPGLVTDAELATYGLQKM